MSSISSTSGPVSRGARTRRRKLPWRKPTLTEVFPGQQNLEHLKALYKQQAEQDGQPDDVWIPPPSPIERLEREREDVAARAAHQPELEDV
jgi:hypothetical protein